MPPTAERTVPVPGRDTDTWVLSLRPPHQRPAADRHQGVLRELERDATGVARRGATVFLTHRECPWRCVMCDLWRYTSDSDGGAGAVPAQLAAALRELAATAPLPEQLKLYDAGSFFDPRAIPRGDHAPIARLLTPVGHVIVESHPALVGTDLDRFLELRERARGPADPTPTLEVAMGLECADARVLERLNKRMTLADFARAASALARRAVALRAFVLLAPPFVAEHEHLATTLSSLAFAFEVGAAVVSLVPTRGGNGALEALAAEGQFREPDLSTIEHTFEAVLESPEKPTGGRVFVDLWDLGHFARCHACLAARRERLDRMNLSQRVLPPVVCAECGTQPRPD